MIRKFENADRFAVGSDGERVTCRDDRHHRDRRKRLDVNAWITEVAANCDAERVAAIQETVKWAAERFD